MKLCRLLLSPPLLDSIAAHAQYDDTTLPSTTPSRTQAIATWQYTDAITTSLLSSLHGRLPS